MQDFKTLMKKHARQNGMLVVVVVIILFFQIITDGVILRPMNIANLVMQNAYVIILATGMMCCILTGGNVDLSVGSLCAFSGAISGLLMIGKGWNTWLVLLIIAREFMVTSVRLVAAGKGTVIAANNWGKVKTVSQIVAICVIMLTQYLAELGSMGILTWVNEDAVVLFWAIGEVFLAVATFFAVLSGLVYLKQNWEIVKTAK